MNTRLAKNTFRFILLSAVVSGAMALTSPPALAQLSNLDKAAEVAYEGSATTDIPTIVASVVQTVLSVTGMIFLVLIIYAGINYLTAAGDEKKVTAAKQTMSHAVIGLIIIIAAYSISNYVVGALVGIASK